MESVVKALAEAFMEQNPDVTVNYSGTGSGTGIQAAIDGTVDLGLASRALKDEEKSNGAVENIVALGRRGRGCQPRERRDRPDRGADRPDLHR